MNQVEWHCCSATIRVVYMVQPSYLFTTLDIINITVLIWLRLFGRIECQHFCTNMYTTFQQNNKTYWFLITARPRLYYYSIMINVFLSSTLFWSLKLRKSWKLSKQAIYWIEVFRKFIFTSGKSNVFMKKKKKKKKYP